MAMQDAIFKFIGSKWFALTLGIVLCFLLPFTFHNASVVFQGHAALSAAGSDQLYYLILAVFACNVLGVLFAFYKFMSLNAVKKPLELEQQKNEW